MAFIDSHIAAPRTENRGVHYCGINPLGPCEIRYKSDGSSNSLKSDVRTSARSSRPIASLMLIICRMLIICCAFIGALFPGHIGGQAEIIRNPIRLWESNCGVDRNEMDCCLCELDKLLIRNICTWRMGKSNDC